MVPEAGFEPARYSAAAFKAAVSSTSPLRRDVLTEVSTTNYTGSLQPMIPWGRVL